MLLSLALSATLAQTGVEMRLCRQPDVHGDTMVFVYAGDLWTSNLSGGLARRLTTHPGGEAFPHFSKDGKLIAFTGTYDGSNDLYVIPAEGGEPKRLTFNPSPDLCRGWTPDGKIAYVTDAGTPGSFSFGLRYMDPKGGLPEVTKLEEIFDLSIAPDGRIAYNRNNSHLFNWRRYRGGTQGRIAISDENASFYKEVPSQRENRWNPLWVGNSIYYIGDKTLGTRNLWAYDSSTGRETQVTNFADADIKWPATDGKTIIFERNGFLQTFDVATKTITTLNPRVATDAIAARPTLRNLAASISNISLSPSGNRIAVEARGEIFSVPARTGETRSLGGDSSSKETNISWSPDGKVIGFLSDKTGEMRIYTTPQMGGVWTEIQTPKDLTVDNFTWAPDSKKVSFWSSNTMYIYDLETKKTDKVFTEKYSGSAMPSDWSADSKWIAYVTSGDNLFTAVHLYNVEKKTNTKVTEGYYSDDAVTFDRNGKYLYIISRRTFNPTGGDFEFNMHTQDAQRVYALILSKDGANPLLRAGDEEPAGTEPKPAGKPEPTDIDLAGLGDRIIPLPWEAGNYGALVGLDNGVMTFAGGTWKMFDFNSKASQDIISGVFMVDLNAARTKLAYFGAGTVGITNLQPGLVIGAGRVNTSAVEAMVDPRDEWKQILWEAWRWERDKYYDKNMLGLDWNKIGNQYAAYLPYVAHRSDLSYVLGLMLGELGTGHSYVQGGDLGDTGRQIPVGMLGADYEVSNGKIRFKKVFRGLNFEEPRRGPLGDPGVNVKEGDYLLEIDGKVLGRNDPGSLLLNKVGRTVKLTVNDKPSSDGARVVTVRPISTEDNLRYITWVEDNRRKVSEMSGGKIGYMHVPDTSIPGVIEFLKGYYSQSDKQAIVIDERYNGGGFIPTFFVEKLARTYNSGFKQREGADISFPNQSLDMPKAMLINEFAGSGGDMLPWLFKQAKLGPLIGNRTWGGLVGITGGAPLVDGGQVTAPEFGIYDRETGEWIAENKGVDPDIQVDLRPDLVAQGRDPQLEKAVEYLLAEMKKSKKPVKEPGFPKVGGGGK